MVVTLNSLPHLLEATSSLIAHWGKSEKNGKILMLLSLNATITPLCKKKMAVHYWSICFFSPKKYCSSRSVRRDNYLSIIGLGLYSGGENKLCVSVWERRKEDQEAHMWVNVGTDVLLPWEFKCFPSNSRGSDRTLSHSLEAGSGSTCWMTNDLLLNTCQVLWMFYYFTVKYFKLTA